MKHIGEVRPALAAHGTIVGDHVELKLELARDGGALVPLGTLRIPHEDYPTFAAMLTIGTDMMRVTYHYDLSCREEAYAGEDGR